MKKIRPKKKFQPPPNDEGDEYYPNGIFDFNITKLLAHIKMNPATFPTEEVEVSKQCW